MSHKMEKGGGSDGHPGRPAWGGAARPHLERPSSTWSRPAPPRCLPVVTASLTATPTLGPINTPLDFTCRVWKLSSSHYRLVLYH